MRFYFCFACRGGEGDGAIIIIMYDDIGTPWLDTLTRPLAPYMQA